MLMKYTEMIPKTAPLGVLMVGLGLLSLLTSLLFLALLLFC